MKNISIVLLFFLSAPLGWGSEDLFSFFSDYKLGSRMSSGNEGYNELSGIELFGHKFNSYYEQDEDKAIRRASLYLGKGRKGHDDPSGDINDVFNRIRMLIVSVHGNAEPIEVPNFQDATERTGSIYAWRDKDTILTLEKIESPSRFEIIVQQTRYDYFVSTLGGDTRAYLLSNLETKSGELRIPASESEANDLPVKQSREVEVKANRESDLAVGVKSAPKQPAAENEKSDAATWPLILGAIGVLGVAVFMIRVFMRGRSS